MMRILITHIDIVVLLQLLDRSPPPHVLGKAQALGAPEEGGKGEEGEAEGKGGDQVGVGGSGGGASIGVRRGRYFGR